MSYKKSHEPELPVLIYDIYPISSLRVLASGMWCRVIWYQSIHVSELHRLQLRCSRGSDTNHSKFMLHGVTNQQKVRLRSLKSES